MTAGEVSVLVRARPNSGSLRTTVPSGIVAQFHLADGDRLDWSIHAAKDNLVIIVTPIQVKNDRRPQRKTALDR